MKNQKKIKARVAIAAIDPEYLLKIHSTNQMLSRFVDALPNEYEV